MKAKVTPEMIEIIEELGQEYKPAVLPADIKRGPIGMCFDFCAMQAAILYPKYKYVEGLATEPFNDQDWIAHAWLTDGEHAFDPTWKATSDKTGAEVPIPSIYVGIPFDIHEVATFMRITGYQGVLGNKWRAPDLVDRMLGRRRKIVTLAKEIFDGTKN